MRTVLASERRPAIFSARPSQEELDGHVARGLEKARWPGRCQIVKDPQHDRITWYIDGAHTTESMTCCGAWFGEQLGASLTPMASERRNILLFNCTSDRAGTELFSALLAAIHSTSGQSQPFSEIVFTPNVISLDQSDDAGEPLPML